jgi:hypothetical protein
MGDPVREHVHAERAGPGGLDQDRQLCLDHLIVFSEVNLRLVPPRGFVFRRSQRSLDNPRWFIGILPLAGRLYHFQHIFSQEESHHKAGFFRTTPSMKPSMTTESFGSPTSGRVRGNHAAGSLTVVGGAKRERKLMTAFGSSASWTMISAISTWSKERCKPSTTLSARRLSPMSQIQRSEPGRLERRFSAFLA